MFPDDTTKFAEWEAKMTDRLRTKDLLYVVLVKSKYVTIRDKLPKEEYLEWLSYCEDRAVAATAVRGTNITADIVNSEDVNFDLNVKKCVRAAGVIKSALGTKQRTLIEGIFPDNPYEIWQKLVKTY